MNCERWSGRDALIDICLLALRAILFLGLVHSRFIPMLADDRDGSFLEEVGLFQD